MRQTTINDLLSLSAIRIAAETVWGEARGEAYEGMLAVAWVIRKRVDEPGKDWWGDDVVSVCTHPFQFSCRNEDDPNSKLLSQVPDDDPVFATCRHAVEEAFLGDKYTNPTLSI